MVEEEHARRHTGASTPQRLHFASISLPNIPTAPEFCKQKSLKIPSLPYCKGRIKHQKYQNQNGRVEEEHARRHTGASTPQRLHFASISPPNIPTANIPTAPAFCKHISPKIASLPYCKGSSTQARGSTQAHTKEHALSTLLSTLPYCKGSIQTSKSKSKWERRSTHAGTQEHAKSPKPLPSPPLPTKLPSIKIIISFPQRLHFASIIPIILSPPKSPQRLHFASIIPTRQFSPPYSARTMFAPMWAQNWQIFSTRTSGTCPAIWTQASQKRKNI